MKFGGTSMGNAERIRVAAELISAEARPVVVVVSAMSRVTDLLLETLRRAELGDRAEVDEAVGRLRARHLEAAVQLFAETPENAQFRQGATGAVQSLIAEFHRIANGVLMLGERPPRSVDEAIAIGERLSAELLAYYLQAKGIAARAVNGADLIVTDAVFGNAISPDGAHTPALPWTAFAFDRERRDSNRNRVQWRNRRWPPDNSGPGRFGFFGFNLGGRTGRARALDLDRRRWDHDG